MKIDYGFDTKSNTIKVTACSLWMDCKLGEGELEIENQGRLQILKKVSRRKQWQMVSKRQGLANKGRSGKSSVQDALTTLARLPIFFTIFIGARL